MTIINKTIIDNNNIIHCQIGIPNHIDTPNELLNAEDSIIKNIIFNPNEKITAITIIIMYGVRIRNVAFQLEYPKVFKVDISGVTESAISFIERIINTIEINEAKNAKA